MKRVLTAIILAFGAVGALSAENPKNEYQSDSLGVSMSVPFINSDAPFYQIAMFFLPPSDGFAANVNIQRQKYTESIESYNKLSMKQMDAMLLTVVKREIKDNEVIYEYMGKMKGKKFHWYVRALKRGNYIYLATATALETHWEEQKAELMKSVDSFKLKKQ